MAHQTYEAVIRRQSDHAAVKEAEERLEVHPSNARIISEEAFYKFQKKPTFVSDTCLDLGRFWFTR